MSEPTKEEMLEFVRRRSEGAAGAGPLSPDKMALIAGTHQDSKAITEQWMEQWRDMKRYDDYMNKLTGGTLGGAPDIVASRKPDYPHNARITFSPPSWREIWRKILSALKRKP